MDVVIRPVNERFLTEVVFPAFQLGMESSAALYEKVLAAVQEDSTRRVLELLLDKERDGVQTESTPHFNELVYPLLFSEWEKSRAGWRIKGEAPAYAGDLEQALHLAMMVEEPRYPYAEA